MMAPVFDLKKKGLLIILILKSFYQKKSGAGCPRLAHHIDKRKS
jgi:hypothetical protein